ncbi:hypothetical protein SH2C18_12240 [Clostridium sediminicola]|uniref:flagellar motor switch protein FliN n=1 Tax=Clostridium sediminicola TaxID=3114879 RepID=UPI0031F23E42
MDKVVTHKDIENFLEEYSENNKNKSSLGNGYIDNNLELILDIPLEISVVLGNTKKTIKEIMNVIPGSIIQLDKSINEPLVINANGKKIGEGEAIVTNEKFCIRTTEIEDKKQLNSNG